MKHGAATTRRLGEAQRASAPQRRVAPWRYPGSAFVISGERRRCSATARHLCRCGTPSALHRISDPHRAKTRAAYPTKPEAREPWAGGRATLHHSLSPHRSTSPQGVTAPCRHPFAILRPTAPPSLSSRRTSRCCWLHCPRIAPDTRAPRLVRAQAMGGRRRRGFC